LESLLTLRVNVSTDWAPGSSGAAVVDECGNVIGHVATIAPLAEGGNNRNNAKKPNDRFDGATLITLHEAIPAAAIKALVDQMNAPAL
jgi:hypothetical protein